MIDNLNFRVRKVKPLGDLFVGNNKNSAYPWSIFIDRTKTVFQFIIIGIASFAVRLCIRWFSNYLISFCDPLLITSIDIKIYQINIYHNLIFF